MNRMVRSRLTCLAIIALIPIVFTSCTTCEQCVEAAKVCESVFPLNPPEGIICMVLVAATCGGLCVCDCLDNDTDGYGNPGCGNCTYPEIDCDDSNPVVNPGANEGPEGDPMCSDTMDNDCDGMIDLNDPGCVPSFDLPSVSVSQGDFLYFIVDPKDGDHGCDSTALDVTIQGGGATWNLASDFRFLPGQANPNPDSYGNSEVWYFMESATLVRDPSTYTLLPNFVTDAFRIEGLEQWQGTDGDDTHLMLPAVGINSTGLAQDVIAFSWEPDVIRVHPLPNKLVVVGWRSLMDGEVRVRGSFVDLDTSCGNGIAWFVDNDAGTLAQGQIP